MDLPFTHMSIRRDLSSIEHSKLLLLAVVTIMAAAVLTFTLVGVAAGLAI